MTRYALAVAATLAACAAVPRPVAVEDGTAPDADDRPLAIRIWHAEDLTTGAAVPLIVISHGTGGSFAGHTDTARALAAAGFVVVSVSHTGDNYQDQSYVGRGQHLVGRPRHISRVIDYMLTTWTERRYIDPARIGVFGHSAGGFTALVLAGGEPDMSRGEAHCIAHPQAWDCEYLRQHGFALANPPPVSPAPWHHDPRIKAAVIAAPAVGYAFEPQGLRHLTIPIQLWVAGHDPVVDDSPAIVRRLLPRAPEYHFVGPAGHLSFITPCNQDEARIAKTASEKGALDCAEPGGFDRGAFHDAFNAAVIAFFNRTL
jgi:predicted dienelactone hydrolase